MDSTSAGPSANDESWDESEEGVVEDDSLPKYLISKWEEVKMVNCSYGYESKVAIPPSDSSSLAASSGKYTAYPLKKIKSYTSDKDARESVKFVQSVQNFFMVLSYTFRSSEK